MIANYLNESVVPRKNNQELSDIIAEYKVRMMGNFTFDLPDGKPGVWFRREASFSDILCIAYSFPVISRETKESGLSVLIDVYHLRSNHKAKPISTMVIGDFVARADRNKPETKKFSESVRKLMRRMANEDDLGNMLSIAGEMEREVQ